MCQLSLTDQYICDSCTPAETSQLIGQWLPVESSTNSVSLQPAVIIALQQLIKAATTLSLLELKDTPALPAVCQQLSTVLETMPQSWLEHGKVSISATTWTIASKGDAPSSQQKELVPNVQLQELLQAADTLLVLLREQQMLLPSQVQLQLHSLQQRLMRLQRQLAQQQQQSADEGMTFAWVESLLVTAMREGHWVRERCSLNAASCTLQYTRCFRNETKVVWCGNLTCQAVYG